MIGDDDDDDDEEEDDDECISRSEVCSRFLAVWWCPKRIQKYRILKYGLSEEAQAQKRTIIIIVIQQLGRSELFFFISKFLFF